MLIYLVVAMLMAMACTGPSTVKDFEQDDDYVIISGVIDRPIEAVDQRRLVLYIKTVNGDIITCITANKENSGLLRSVRKRINSNPQLDIVVFGKRVEENGWYEYLEGVDVEMYAISYFPYPGGKRQTVLVTFGTRMTDMMKSVSWSKFLMQVGGKAIKAAI